MKIKKEKVPKDSSISKFLDTNYHDVYQCTIQNNQNITPDDVQVTFWTIRPKWIENLFKIRTAIVKPFGLKTEKLDVSAIDNCIRNGENHHFFTLVEKSENENIIKLSDKHLDAWFSVYFDEKQNKGTQIYFTTVVNFKNILGYAYFYGIYPLHHLVVKQMMRFCIKQLLKD